MISGLVEGSLLPVDYMTNDHAQALLGKCDNELFLHGGCHIFAIALAQRYGYSLCMVRNTQKTRPEGAAHVFCVFKSETHDAVDVVGLFNVSDLLVCNDWTDEEYYRVEDCSGSDLSLFSTQQLGGGLYTLPAFVKKAHSRALCLIECYGEYYSGRNPAPVPGFSRCGRKVDVREVLKDLS